MKKVEIYYWSKKGRTYPLGENIIFEKDIVR